MTMDYFSTINGINSGVIEPKSFEPPARQNAGAPPAPFQKFLDMAVGALEDVSKMEVQTNDLVNQYVAGKASIQEVMTASAKMGIAIQLAVTVTTSAVTAFKEITQMPV